MAYSVEPLALRMVTLGIVKTIGASCKNVSHWYGIPTNRRNSYATNRGPVQYDATVCVTTYKGKHLGMTFLLIFLRFKTTS